ncbi:FUSC family protein [Thiomonas sp. FB-Cd]|uniref:FUSC family protein n=1 Tax=Thiomonas sp. FB-Cd TaxID=1158292 RepID=UPI000690391B|nr:FUSC family protein [Thiomonas sp. FB-Cd]
MRLQRPPSGASSAGSAARALLRIARAELSHLGAIHPSDRPWAMPVAASLASGLPLLAGAYFGHIGYGLISSLGGMVFLYLPETSMQHRMLWLMACASGMMACYTLGLASEFSALLRFPALTFMAVLVMMTLRLYGVGPPGGVFFIMAAAIGAYTPVAPDQFPYAVGLFALGTLVACAVAFAYSVHTLRRRPPKPVPALPAPSFDFVVYDSVVIGLCVGASLGLAQLLQMQRPYWVPVSCLAVIQGASLRAVWTKQLQRILGTTAGVGVAWALLLPLGPWGIALAVMVLTVIVEAIVVRNYGVAAIFITPLTILLADAANLAGVPAGTLLHARLLDTVLGALFGLLGGVCLHHGLLRDRLSSGLRRLILRPPA